ncbi:hypothetical protein MWU54_10700 [Marivita sp. S6314]|nr:hypothetical protein [Marivita sp. S6314]MCK0150494.1 hypothetical protein [Marivita sp. S6314]
MVWLFSLLFPKHETGSLCWRDAMYGCLSQGGTCEPGLEPLADMLGDRT